MEKNLVFNATLTVEQFKDKMHVSRIDVKRNYYHYGKESCIQCNFNC
nr:MAG TPA: hypothetical protein [Crassvirales sp.]